LSFAVIFRYYKTTVPGLSCGVVCVILYTFSRFSRTPICDRQTERQTHDDGIYRGSVDNQTIRFLQRDAILPRYMPSSCVCLSVCLSQVGVLLKRLNVYRITQTTPHDSPGRDCSFVVPKDYGKAQTGHPQLRRQMQVG